MRHARRSRLFTLLFACIFVFGLSQTAMAAPIGTPAGTDLVNQATINYDVGGNPQPPEDTNILTLETDRKLDVLVDEFSNGTHTAYPGDTAANMTLNKCLGFNVTNESNATLDFPLSVNETSTTDPFGGTDNFNTSGCQIRLDDGDGDCETSAAGDTAITSINDLASGDTVKIWVACTMPSQADGDIAAVSLIAKFAETDGTAINTDDNGSADTPGAIDDVFADGNCPATQTSPGGCQSGNDVNYDGKHSDTDSFTFASANLSLVKTSVVYSDPINGVSADAKAIPGAIITYTITVTNNGVAAADNVIVSDDLSAMSSYIVFLTQFNDGVDSCAALEGIVVSTAGTPCETNAVDADSANYNAGTSVVTGNIGTVAGSGGSQTVKFQVTVQ